MERVTISLDDELAQDFDALVKRRGYHNRSEAVRDLLRQELDADRVQQQQGPQKATHCVAALSYVYNHHERQLAGRLTAMQHEHHDLTVSAMHAHLDHDHCIETQILRGRVADVTVFAESIIAQTGVRHGRLNLIPVALEDARKAQHHHVHAHPHT